MNIFWKVTLKFLALNRTRTIVTIVGIILSASMITAVTTLISSLQDYMLENAIYENGDWHGAFYDIDDITAEKIKSDKGIKYAAFADNIGYAFIGSSNKYKPYLFIMGADDLFLDIMPIHLISGELPKTSEEIILPYHLATNGGVYYEIGDRIQLEIGDRYSGDYKLMQNNPYLHPDDIEDSLNESAEGEKLVIRETRTYTVVGFYERPGFEEFSAPGYTAITKIDPGHTSGSFAVYFKMKKPKETFDYVNGFRFSGETNNEVLLFSGVSKYSNFYTVLYSLAAILIGLIMFGSVSLIYNAFAISVSERTRQFGLLASVGATKRQTRKMVLYEALFLSVIGIPLGIFSGILGIGITLSLVGDKFYAFYGTEGLKLDLHVSVESIVVACLVALITILISAWIPSKRAARVTPIEAIRLSKDIRVRARDVKTSRLTYKLFGLEGMIAKKHFKRNRKKYRATVVSLFMSIVLFISASSFCSYLTDAVSGTMQDSDYDIYYRYVNGKGEVADPEKLKAIYDDLSAINGVVASSYLLFKGTMCSIQTDLCSEDYLKYTGLTNETSEKPSHTEIYVSVYGIGDEVYKKYLKANRLDERVYMDRDNPRGIAQAVISKFDVGRQRFITVPIFKDKTAAFSFEQYDFERWNKLTEEERKQLMETGGDSEYKTSVELTFDITDRELVLGLNESIKNSIKIMYPLSIYQELFGSSTSGNYFYFSTKNPTKTYELIEHYLAANNLQNGLLVNVYEMNETDRNMVVIIKVFSYGFITLISLIAVANVFNTISTNIMLRRREFAMLKSVGMTTRGFNRMMNFECILYGLKSLRWGIPVAFGVTWLIFRSIESGYDTRFYLPWTAVAIAVCSVFAVVFATMVYSMRKIKKDNPIDALKNENL